MLIRPAALADLPAINAIYNHYVLHSTATFQDHPATDSERLAWFRAHDPNHPILVAEEPNPHAASSDPASSLRAWASLSPFHPRSAYRFTVEDSVYVHPGHLRRRLGRALLEDLIVRARSLGHHSIIALISNDQTPSLALHAALGFTQAGLLKQAGFKFDRFLDVAYLQLLL